MRRRNVESSSSVLPLSLSLSLLAVTKLEIRYDDINLTSFVEMILSFQLSLVHLILKIYVLNAN